MKKFLKFLKQIYFSRIITTLLYPYFYMCSFFFTVLLFYPKERVGFSELSTMKPFFYIYLVLVLLYALFMMFYHYTCYGSFYYRKCVVYSCTVSIENDLPKAVRGDVRDV